MRRFALAAALSFVGATVFAQDVKTDFDKSADFSKYKTFAVKIGTSWNNQISEKRITDEIEQTLAEKGWTKTDANPDALVLLHGATEKQQNLNTFYSGTGGYGAYRYRGWGGMGGMGTATTTVSCVSPRKSRHCLAVEVLRRRPETAAGSARPLRDCAD